MKLAILGATGMLGKAVVEEFKNFEGDVLVTSRRDLKEKALADFRKEKFTANSSVLEETLRGFGKSDFIINCIGVIKPLINDENSLDRRNALEVNALFPYELADFGEKFGTRTIQIATDCVYSGSRGGYSELDRHDPLDVYGKTKSLGEAPSPHIQHLRVSIIGPEMGKSTSLVEWVRNQPQEAKIEGYLDHKWNGVTSMQFARVAKGIITNNLFRSGVQHLVPAGDLNKFDLVSGIAKAYNRRDIEITPHNTNNPINRTLRTLDPQFNSELWSAAGYRKPPTMAEIISDLSIKRETL